MSEKDVKILFGKDMLDTLKETADLVYKIVGSTMGPRGRYVLLDRANEPIVTNDGVTIAHELVLEDDFQNIITKILRQAALKTNNEVGDGTTTAIVLATTIIKHALKYIEEGINPILIKRGIDAATQALITSLRRYAEPLQTTQQLKQIATIAGNNDPFVGEVVAEAFNHITNDGIILIEDSDRNETYIELVNGYAIDKGYISPYFVNTERGEVVLKDPYILIADARLSNIRPLIPLLEKVAASGRPLVVIAQDVTGEVLKSMIVNKIQRGYPSVAVAAPEFGIRRADVLQDIAVLTGGKVLGETGFKFDKATLSDLGQAKEVKVSATQTLIVQGAGDPQKIQNRIEYLRHKKAEMMHDEEWYDERIAKLSGGICIIRAWGQTEAEREELKMRLDDAVSAVNAASESGIIAGGGVTALRLAKEFDQQTIDRLSFANRPLLEEEKIGVKIVVQALKEPIKLILTNAGLSEEKIKEIIHQIEQSDNPHFGYDALKMQMVNLMKEGIIDPASVLANALQNGTSAAGMLLTTSIIVNKGLSSKTMEAELK
jgi:chaperonin GroEL